MKRATTRRGLLSAIAKAPALLLAARQLQAATDKGRAAPRFIFIYTPGGRVPSWRTDTPGRDYKLGPTMSMFEPYRRRMAILGYDPDRTERGGGTQDRSDIVRIGDLVEDEQHSTIWRLRQHVSQPNILQRLDLDHYPLMRRVMRHHPSEIRRFGHDDRHFRRELHEVGRLACGPRLQHLAVGIIERSGNSMLSPEPGTL